MGRVGLIVGRLPNCIDVAGYDISRKKEERKSKLERNIGLHEFDSPTYMRQALFHALGCNGVVWLQWDELAALRVTSV